MPLESSRLEGLWVESTTSFTIFKYVALPLIFIEQLDAPPMEGCQVFYPRLKFSIGLFDSFSSSMLLFTKIPENENEAWGDFQFCSRHTPSDVTNFIQMVIHFQNGISSRTTYTVDF